MQKSCLCWYFTIKNWVLLSRLVAMLSPSYKICSFWWKDSVRKGAAFLSIRLLTLSQLTTTSVELFAGDVTFQPGFIRGCLSQNNKSLTYRFLPRKELVLLTGCLLWGKHMMFALQCYGNSQLCSCGNIKSSFKQCTHGEGLFFPAMAQAPASCWLRSAADAGQCRLTSKQWGALNATRRLYHIPCIAWHTGTVTHGLQRRKCKSINAQGYLLCQVETLVLIPLWETQRW